MPTDQHHRAPSSLAVALGVALALAAVAPACSSPSGPEVDAEGRTSVYVTVKAMPVGMLLAAAERDDVLERRTIPADVAGADAVDDLTGIECLVAAQSLPAGTVLRREQLVEPAALGLDRGLTGDTGPRPAGC